MTTSEARYRIEIDRLLTAAGWRVCGYRQANLHATRGVAIREFPLEAGHGDADYLFYMDGDAAGLVAGNKHVIEGDFVQETSKRIGAFIDSLVQRLSSAQGPRLLQVIENEEPN